MRIIGLTGGIGAGKSQVSAWFAAQGLPVIDADAVYHDLCRPNQSCWLVLVDAFGASILNPDQTLNRAALAEVVFADAAQLGRLNDLTHPLITAEIQARLDALAKGELWILPQDEPGDLTKSQRSPPQKIAHAAVVLEAPLLFECGLNALCDVVLWVWAERPVRAARVQARSELTPAQIEARMNAQMTDEAYAAHNPVRIDNNGDWQNTRRSLEAWFFT